MSSCEKCWSDALDSEDACQPDRYRELIELRKGNPCTPEEQAGPDATECPECKRMSQHQITGQCMTPTCDAHKRWRRTR